MALANTIAVRDRLLKRQEAVVRELDRVREGQGGPARKNARLVRLAKEAAAIGAAVARLEALAEWQATEG
jgi:hypothetical protein